jgi:cell division transport system permease protein
VTLWRVIVYACKHFPRNAWINLATVFVLVLSLLSVNVVVGVGAMLDRAVSTLEEKVDVTVFFKEGTPDAVLQQANFFLADLPQVKNVYVQTPAEALEAFKERHQNDPKILEALAELDKNPLGASLVLKARTTDDYPFLLEALKNPQFGFAIESKTYDDHAQAIAKVRDIGRSVRLFGYGLIAIFGLFSVLIVYNAIRVAIYTQREEIGIMRLVGASGMFVRFPFVIEGMLLAVLALILAGFVVVGAIAFFEPRLIPVFDGADPGLKMFFFENATQLVLLEGGALLGLVALSSWAAVGKYLKR